VYQDMRPRSALPAGGSPADDKAYLAWRSRIVDEANARILDRHDWREDIWFIVGVIEAYRLDYHLFKATAGETLFENANASHRLRHLANSLRDHPRAMARLAAEFCTWTTNEYEGRDGDARTSR